MILAVALLVDDNLPFIIAQWAYVKSILEDYRKQFQRH